MHDPYLFSLVLVLVGCWAFRLLGVFCTQLSLPNSKYGGRLPSPIGPLRLRPSPRQEKGCTQQCGHDRVHTVRSFCLSDQYPDACPLPLASYRPTMLTPSRRLPNVVLAVLSLLSCCCWTTVHARQAKENRRDFQKLDNGALATLANLGPAQWESVDEGHLQHLLIPRVCTLLLLPRPLLTEYSRSLLTAAFSWDRQQVSTHPLCTTAARCRQLIYTAARWSRITSRPCLASSAGTRRR